MGGGGQLGADASEATALACGDHVIPFHAASWCSTRPKTSKNIRSAAHNTRYLQNGASRVSVSLEFGCIGSRYLHNLEMKRLGFALVLFLGSAAFAVASEAGISARSRRHLTVFGKGSSSVAPEEKTEYVVVSVCDARARRREGRGGAASRCVADCRGCEDSQQQAVCIAITQFQ